MLGDKLSLVSTTLLSGVTVGYSIFYVSTFIYLLCALINIIALCSLLGMYFAFTGIVSLLCILFLIYRINTLRASVRPVDNQGEYYPIGHNTQLIKWEKTLELRLNIATALSLVFIGVVAVVQLTFTIFTSVILTKSTPQYSGSFYGLTTRLSTPNTPPIIERDVNNVIHVTAQNDHDLFFAQGFAMAQERIFQMDLQRRLVKGELAEVVGNAGLNSDRFWRTLNLKQSLVNDTANLQQPTRQALQAFTDGINGYLDTTTTLTIEFWLLNYTPAPFTIADILANIKLLAWTLDGNLNAEFDRYQLLLNGADINRVSTLFPPYSPSAPTTINTQNRKLLSTFNKEKTHYYQPTPEEIAAGPYKQGDRSTLNRWLPASSESYKAVQASNDWVIGGRLTDTGLPYLACDTHLSLTAVGPFVLMHLRVDESGQFNGTANQYQVDSIGAALVGAPTIIIGRNTNGVSWGLTNVGADTKDCFVLEEANNGTSYVLKDKTQVNYTFRKEIIKVKNSEDNIIVIKESSYGPVINDIMYPPGRKPLALRWLGASYQGIDDTVGSFIKMLRVSNYDQFKEAFRYYVGPAQNIVYADPSGTIGYLLPGRLPVRSGGYDGTYSVPGDGTYDWIGYVDYYNMPFMSLTSEQQSSVQQPYIVSSNNKASPTGDFPAIDTNLVDWLVDDYRVTRILNMIEQKRSSNLTLRHMQDFQLDVQSEIFNRHKDVIQNFAAFSDSKVDYWRMALSKWDGYCGNNKETTVFEEWLWNLGLLAGNEFFNNTRSDVEYRFVSARYVFKVYYDERNTNVTDVDCKPYGSCSNFVRQMFEKSVNKLLGHFRDVPTWGQTVHYTSFDHPLFKDVVGLSCVSCRRSYTKGASQTVNVATPRRDDINYASDFGPAYRQLIDIKNPENSLFILPMGQSGNMLYSGYDNYLSSWTNGVYIPMQMRGYKTRYHSVFAK
ncbi:hypothetical protein AKO1_015513 [Acrasis kona]|uniref:Penicillin amidase n=1 Tax=Acrasis kona TaxID=1008807 RepID=A0AAW2YK75_9EUKA